MHTRNIIYRTHEKLPNSNLPSLVIHWYTNSFPFITWPWKIAATPTVLSTRNALSGFFDTVYMLLDKGFKQLAKIKLSETWPIARTSSPGENSSIPWEVKKIPPMTFYKMIRTLDEKAVHLLKMTKTRSKIWEVIEGVKSTKTRVCKLELIS